MKANTPALKQLIDGGYMEDVEDPDTKKTVEAGGGYQAEKSFVTITNGKVKKVTLQGNERYIDAEVTKLNRDAVTKGTAPTQPTTPTTPPPTTP